MTDDHTCPKCREEYMSYGFGCPSDLEWTCEGKVRIMAECKNREFSTVLGQRLPCCETYDFPGLCYYCRESMIGKEN